MVFVVDSDRRETEMLARLARLLTATLDVENVGGQLADVLLSLFGVQSSSLRLLAPDRSVVVLACAGRSRGYFDPGYVTPPGQGVVGRAVGTGQPVQTADLLGESWIVLDPEIRDRVLASRDPRVTCTSEMRTLLEQNPTRAALAVPLIAQGRVLGAVFVRRMQPFDERAITLGRPGSRRAGKRSPL